MAAQLCRALEPDRPDAAVETARVLHDAARLPDEARQALLARIARDATSDASERLAAAFPEASDKRHRLGEALAWLGGSDPQHLSRTAVEARVVQALATLGRRPQAVSSPATDVVERRRDPGPFGGRPAASSPPERGPDPPDDPPGPGERSRRG